MLLFIVDILIKIISIISKTISFLYEYRKLFKITGLLATRKFKAAKNNHKYAILVAARNEATVIGNLIDSIRKQDYPAELIDIFVVADNCTDNTAEISRNMGAVCYERFDTQNRTKGFALQFLVNKIKEDYGIEAYEGYMIFDADNLLKHDYISRMNDAFDAGEKIVTSYRNSKNFDDNWIAASYGVHWLRTVRNEHRARSLFHLATRIQGTGFLFANELIKNGWNYTSLTEDRAFCADAVANGYKISYNHDAEFYDEQPVDIKIAMRQRIRWAKGHLQAFCETGPKLLWHIFYVKKTVKEKGFLRNLRMRLMSFDMLTVVFPNGLYSVIKKILLYILRTVLIFETGKVFGVGYAPDLISNLFKLFGITVNPTDAMQKALWLMFFTFAWTISSYLNGILTAAYVYIIEHKRIKPIKWYKKLWFCLTFPIFDLIGKLSMCIALFIKVEWKAIPHNSSVTISNLDTDVVSEKENKKEPAMTGSTNNKT